MKKTLHKGAAMNAIESLIGEVISKHVENAHLGLLGATRVETWTSKDGGTLRFEMSNGGCTLIAEPTK